MKNLLRAALVGTTALVPFAANAQTQQQPAQGAQAQAGQGASCDQLVVFLRDTDQDQAGMTMEQAERLVQGGDQVACEQALTEVRARVEQGGTQAQGQTEIQGQATGAQIVVDQPEPTVTVQQPAPEVAVTQAPPQVTVRQPEPEVIVRQAQPVVRVVVPPPQITIEQPEPEIIVRMPQPEVMVRQAQPQVSVNQAQPQVDVQQAQPQVQVQQAQPQVNVEQGGEAQVRVQQGQPTVRMSEAQQAEVTVEQAQPRVSFERAEPRVEVEQAGEAQVQFTQTGEPNVRFEQMEGGQQAQEGQQAMQGQQAQQGQAPVATMPVPTEPQQGQQQGAAVQVEQQGAAVQVEQQGLAQQQATAVQTQGTATQGQATAGAQMIPVVVSDLTDVDVVNAEGEQLGDVKRVVRDQAGQTFVVVGHGGFLGLGEKEIALPLDQMWMRGEDLVIQGVADEQIAEMPAFENSDQYAELEAGENVEFRAAE